MTTNLREFLDAAIKANPIEARIVRKVVKALRDAGDPVVAVWDTEERTEASTTAAILDLVFNLDLAYLVTASGGWVMIVMGNEWDAVSDYTVSLEPALAGVNEWVERNAA